jgi:hypothetical protein
MFCNVILSFVSDYSKIRDNLFTNPNSMMKEESSVLEARVRIN